VYTPQEQMRVADIARQTREIEMKLRESAPDWLERMDRGR
jgi:hypothetical protein